MIYSEPANFNGKKSYQLDGHKCHFFYLRTSPDEGSFDFQGQQ